MKHSITQFWLKSPCWVEQTVKFQQQPLTNVISIRYLLQSNSNWEIQNSKMAVPNFVTLPRLLPRFWLVDEVGHHGFFKLRIGNRFRQQIHKITRTENLKKKTAKVVDKLARRKLNRFYHLSYFSLYFYGEFTISTEIKFKFRFPFCDINTSFYQVNCD